MTSAAINTDTVEMLHTTVSELAAAEEARGRSFNERAGSLLGFTGVILALSAGFATLVVRDGGAAPVLVLFLAVLAGVRTAFACIAVLRPELWHFKLQSVDAFASLELQRRDPVQIRRGLLYALVRQIADEREVNEQKSEHILAAFRWLTVTLLLVGGGGGYSRVEEPGRMKLLRSPFRRKAATAAQAPRHVSPFDPIEIGPYPLDEDEKEAIRRIKARPPLPLVPPTDGADR